MVRRFTIIIRLNVIVIQVLDLSIWAKIAKIVILDIETII